MSITPKIIRKGSELDDFKKQLKSSALPHEDLSAEGHLLFGYYNQDDLIGTGAIEIYGSNGLLRSVSVSDKLRGQQFGKKITGHLIEQAKEKNLQGLYLLTETARDFFSKIGFEVIERTSAPKELQVSSEFSHVCPVSAVCMFLDLKVR